MLTILHIFMVGIGGFFGAVARYSMSKWMNKGYSIPFGTLTVNLLGAFLLGIITGAKVDLMVLLLVGTGFLGAFTTFSTLKLEMVHLLLTNYKKELIFYAIATYGGGLILAYVGYNVGVLFI